MATFAIFFLVPTDPARALAGTDDQAAVLRARHFLDLDKPIYVQYVHLLRHVVIDHDLGHSFASRSSVNDAILRAAPVTISLVVGGMMVWVVVSFTIGLVGALRPGSWRDKVGMTFVLTGISVHPVWLGLVLSYVFGYKLGWTPLTGYCNFAGRAGTI